MKNLLTFLEEWSSIILAFVAIVISIVSLVKSSKAQKVQTKLNEIEILIKKHQLDQIKEEQELKKSACIEARVVSVTSSKHKIKIWNSGNAKAYNINVEIEDGAPIVFGDNLLPFDELEAGKSFDVPLITYMGLKRKFYIITKWIDDNGTQQQKQQMTSY